ncbi:hypothetical protein AKJ18_04745 [Vibrio xuii]|nr:hypothetical protein AKJ18_04745 [Vibrio xuii]
MKRIVHVQVQPKLSGVQNVSLEILKSLSVKEYEKFIIFGNGEIPSELYQILTEHNINLIQVSDLVRDVGLRDFSAFFSLMKIFREYKFDIIHTNSTKPAVLGRLAAFCSKVVSLRSCLIIHTVHGIAFHKYEPLIKRMFYFIIELISCLFGSVNVSVNKYYLRFYPNLFIRNIAIYNGVDISKMSIDIIKNRTGVFRVGFFARLDKQKDPLMFIQVIHNLHAKGYPLKAEIAGDGPLLDCCRKLVDDLEINDVVTFHGWVQDKESFFNNVDLLLQPSRWEAFGLNIVEAGLHKVPTVASSVEGIPEVIEHKVTGVLAEEHSIDSYSSCIVTLLNDLKLLDVMSEECREIYSKKFPVGKMTKSYERLYRL